VLPGIGYQEMMMFMILAVVLFGSRLPEVMKNFGRAYSQFRKGLSDFQYTIEDPSPTTTTTSKSVPRVNYDENEFADEPMNSTSAPRFQAPPSADED